MTRAELAAAVRKWEISLDKTIAFRVSQGFDQEVESSRTPCDPLIIVSPGKRRVASDIWKPLDQAPMLHA